MQLTGTVNVVKVPGGSAVSYLVTESDSLPGSTPSSSSIVILVSGDTVVMADCAGYHASPVQLLHSILALIKQPR
jgi:hypothetical protein